MATARLQRFHLAVGPAAIGYGETFIVTNLADMQGGYTTLYFRKTFDVDSLAA